jgi:hypothetical protein
MVHCFEHATTGAARTASERSPQLQSLVQRSSLRLPGRGSRRIDILISGGKDSYVGHEATRIEWVGERDRYSALRTLAS